MSNIRKISFLIWLIPLFLSCAPAKKDYTIKYPAYLIKEHPKSFWNCYVKVEGVVELKALPDQIPPLSGKDFVICDKTGCVYIHSDMVDLKDYVGRKVKVLGYVKVSMFNTAYVDVLEIKVLDEDR